MLIEYEKIHKKLKFLQNRKNMTQKIRYISSIFLVLILLSIVSQNIFAQFSLSLGYSYVNIYSIIETSYLPSIGLNYLFSSNLFNFSFKNLFFYSLDNYFLDYLSTFISYTKKDNIFSIYFLYEAFDFILINEDYYPGNIFFSQIKYSNSKKNIFSIEGYFQYYKLINAPIDSPLSFEIDTKYIVPFSRHFYTASLLLDYQTDDTFSSSLLNAELSNLFTFFPALGESLKPEITFLGGYSYNNTNGNYLGMRISNIFSSAFVTTSTFSTQLLIEYKNYLTSVLPDDKDILNITEKISLASSISNDFSIIPSIIISFNYFPQVAIPSSDNRIESVLQALALYNFNKILSIDILAKVNYSYWILNEAKNNISLVLELVLKIIPGETLIIILFNDIDATFSQDYELTDIYSQIKIMFSYIFSKSFSINATISYKNYINEILSTSNEYFYVDFFITFII